jgi:hypothetical protein
VKEELFMEKKARVQRLSRQDDVKRSWAEAYQHLEEVDVEPLAEEEGERAETDSPPKDLEQPNPKQ